MYPSPDSAEQPVDSDSSAEQPDHYCSVYSSKPPPPAQKCAVCNQACLGPVIWTKHEVPRPTCGQTCYQKTWHLQGITRGDDRDQGERHSGFTKSSAEQPAFWPEARCPPEDLRALLRERYHPPGYPKGLGDSRHLDGRIAADASRQNGFGSAEQSAPLPKAVSLVPVSSPQLNTGLRESNPQSGDLVPCYGAKQPPPHVHRNPHLGPSGSAAQPAGPSTGSQICSITKEEIIFITKQWGKRQGIKNRSITREEIIFTRPTIPTTRQSRDVSDEQTPREECKEVSNEEAKKTPRVMIYEYHSGQIGIMKPEDTQYLSACRRPSLCDALMDTAIPVPTQGACKWCTKTFDATTSEGFLKKVAQHLSNNQKCLRKRNGLTPTPEDATKLSDEAANILRLNLAKSNARDSLIGSEFDLEFLDAWDRRLREAHSTDAMHDVIEEFVEVIRWLRRMGYLRESPHPPGMRRPPSYVVPSQRWVKYSSSAVRPAWKTVN